MAWVSLLASCVMAQVHLDLVDSGTSSPLSFYGIVSMGPQRTPLKILMDTGSFRFWVRDSGCMKATFCQGPYYNHSLSSSYEGPLGKIETITYGDGSKVGGHLGKDQVSIGGATILSQEFVQATHFSQMMTGLDGIMGLTLSSDHLVYRDIPNTAPVFSYFIKEGDLTGGITFGAIDTKRYGGPLLWVPILNGHSKSPSHWLKDLLCIFKGREEEKNRDVWQHWDIELVSAKIGNTDLKIPSSFTVLPDTGSSLAIFPSSEAQLINMALGMSPVMGRPDTYTIKCDSIANLPNMTFNFVTGPIVLTPFDYTYTKGGVCLSGISGGSPSNKQIVFGNVFLRRFYTVFDFKAKKIGFAVANRNINMNPVFVMSDSTDPPLGTWKHSPFINRDGTNMTNGAISRYANNGLLVLVMYMLW